MVPGQCSMPGMLNHHYTLTGHSTNIYRVNDSHLIWANFSKRLWYGISESRESFWSFPRVIALWDSLRDNRWKRGECEAASNQLILSTQSHTNQVYCLVLFLCKTQSNILLLSLTTKLLNKLTARPIISIVVDQSTPSEWPWLSCLMSHACNDEIHFVLAWKSLQRYSFHSRTKCDLSSLWNFWHTVNIFTHGRYFVNFRSITCVWVNSD